MMQLWIEGELRRFIPLKEFREIYHLPDTFGVAMFEPKTYTGLGKIESAGPELNILRRALLDAIPTAMPLQEWLAYLPNLTRLFEDKLHEINPEIGLKNVEIEFAASGFQDVCQQLLYTMIQARSAGAPLPEFRQIYNNWLNSSVRVSATTQTLVHNGEVWAVQVVHTVYGRVGLVIWTQEKNYYVQDSTLGCPAEGFMQSLLHEVAARIFLATEDTPSATTPT